MENLNSLQAKLLNDVEPKTLIDSIKPMSTSGTVFRNNWLKFFENKGVFNYTAANAFVAGSSKLSVTDPSIANARNTIIEYLSSEPIKSKLAIVAESAQSMSRNNVKDSLQKRLDDILGLSESAAKAKINNGLLDSFSSMFGLSSVITEASANTVRTNTDTIEISTPVSYAEVKEGNTYVRYGRYIFKITENSIELGKSPSERFTYLSSVVEHTKYGKDGFAFETEFGKFKVNESGIFSEEDEKITVESFISSSKVVIESKFVGAGSKTKRNNNYQLADAIVALKENFDSIVKLDNFVIAENANFNERIGLIVGGHQAIVFVESSKRYPANVQHFNTVTEAVNRFNTLSKTDISDRFSILIEAEKMKDDEDAEYVKDCQEEIAGIESKMEEIEDAAKETERGSDAHTALDEAYTAAKLLLNEAKEKLHKFIESKR